MRRAIKLFFVGLLFVGLGLFNIGGCGDGGNGGGGLVQICNMPPLDTDFTDLAYFFIDPVANAGLTVSSTGSIVIFSVETIPTSGMPIFVRADVNGPNNCTIVDVTIDLETFFPATGTCERQDGGGVFVVNDLSSEDVDFPLLVGECVDEAEVVDIASTQINAVKQRSQELGIRSLSNPEPTDIAAGLRELSELLRE